MLKIYLSLLVIVFSAQLLLCIFALAYQDEILPYLERGMLSALEAFSPNSPIQIGFNEMQKDLSCCGVRNATDWVKNFKYIIYLILLTPQYNPLNS